MIFPPFSAPADFKSAVISPVSIGDACWFIFSGNQLLVGENLKSLPISQACTLQRTLYMGTWKDKHVFTGEAQIGSSPQEGWVWSPMRPLHATFDAAEYALAGRAMQLIHWDRSNQYCGFCGNPTFPREQERCRECKACGHLAFPKQSMAVLALVRKGNQILLARGHQFPEPFFSALAGFVDPGETLEQCVMREVFEEVGIKVKNVRYFGSQPWPLSQSFMIGFSCEWQEGEIQIDPVEIAEAAWFDRSNLPRLPPVFSLSRYLIDAFTPS
jgi:NAD+ diphosphatase